MSVTTHTDDKEIVTQLNKLISYHRAAIEACDAAAARLDEVEERAEMRHFVSDHLRNVEELSRCVEAVGGKPTADKAEMTNDREDIVELERDERLLTAILADEEKMAEVYRAIHSGTDEHSQKISAAIDKAMSAVERHRDWLRQRLQS